MISLFKQHFKLIKLKFFYKLKMFIALCNYSFKLPVFILLFVFIYGKKVIAVLDPNKMFYSFGISGLKLKMIIHFHLFIQMHKK